jgi:hypothetical protein
MEAQTANTTAASATRRTLAAGASYGWVNDWWTAKRVAELIRLHFCQRILRKLKAPKTHLRVVAATSCNQLCVGNDEIESWLAMEYPCILDRAIRRKSLPRVVDETGFMLAPLLHERLLPWTLAILRNRRSTRPYFSDWGLGHQPNT